MAIISLISSLSPLGECVLGLCEEVKTDRIKNEIAIELNGFDCETKYFEGNQPIKE